MDMALCSKRKVLTVEFPWGIKCNSYSTIRKFNGKMYHFCDIWFQRVVILDIHSWIPLSPELQTCASFLDATFAPTPRIGGI